MTCVTIHLFLIINTLVCFWQVESRRASALHLQPEPSEKRGAHCSAVHAEVLMLGAFNLTVKKRLSAGSGRSRYEHGSVLGPLCSSALLVSSASCWNCWLNVVVPVFRPAGGLTGRRCRKFSVRHVLIWNHQIPTVSTIFQCL